MNPQLKLPKTKNEYWYFSFCFKHPPLRNRYLRIRGSYSEARNEVMSVIGPGWAFQYGPDEFDGQPEKYDLKRISLIEARAHLKALGEDVPDLGSPLV